MGTIRASRGMNEKSYPLPIVASSVGSLNKPSHSNEPFDTASHLVTGAVHIIIMIDISIATVAQDSCD